METLWSKKELPFFSQLERFFDKRTFRSCLFNKIVDFVRMQYNIFVHFISKPFDPDQMVMR